MPRGVLRGRAWTDEETVILRRHCAGWQGKRSELCQLLASVLGRSAVSVRAQADYRRLWPPRPRREVHP